MMNQLALPSPKMTNSLMPRPTNSGVIGPPRMKMPETASKGMPRSMGGSLTHLGPKLKPLPQAPLQNMGPGATPSLLHADGRGKSGLNGIGKF